MIKRELTSPAFTGTIDYQAEELRIEGDIQSLPDEASVHRQCSFAATNSETQSTSAVSGEICGRPVTWIYYQASCGV
jgi:hypothetical protein